jgi:hypothetical protein
MNQSLRGVAHCVFNVCLLIDLFSVPRVPLITKSKQTLQLSSPQV